MAKRKMKEGTCRLCKQEKKLSYEHIPPRAAYNKNTRYYSIPYDEFTKSQNFLEYEPKGRIHQGGIGYYSLCRNCNSFLNDNYVRSFSKWVNIGMDLNLKYKFNYVEFTAMNQNPFRILKQIISMFICRNEHTFTDSYPELLEFITHPDLKELPEKYKIYLYLNNEGQIRTSPWSFTNTYGMISELTFPPFGYVLNIDNDNGIDNMTEISGWKNYTDERNHSFDIGLYKYPTYLPIPLDFRTKDQIELKYKETKANR